MLTKNSSQISPTQYVAMLAGGFKNRENVGLIFELVVICPLVDIFFSWAASSFVSTCHHYTDWQTKCENTHVTQELVINEMTSECGTYSSPLSSHTLTHMQE